MSLLLQQLSSWIWGPPLIILLLGGGLYFAIFSRLKPLRYFYHAVDLLRGRHDDEKAPGELTHFRALCTALSGTVGMGNVAGVAVALTQGGPGAIFWMWVCALFGMITKFFTCTLAVMYRGKDTTGQEQGGPMYVIMEGLGHNWKPLAQFFCLCGLFGCLPLLQSNQLTGIVREMFFEPMEIFVGGEEQILFGNILFGCLLATLVGTVVIGGVSRVGRITSKLVPAMVLLYGFSAMLIIGSNLGKLPNVVISIFSDAFTGQAIAGGALGVVIMTGIRRAAFSNEAGMGTEAMAHGAARTNEPTSEGLVAMIGPVIDTLVLCSLTALAILVTDVSLNQDTSGILITKEAFAKGIPNNTWIGPSLLLVSVLFLSYSSMLGFSYYVLKCGAFLFGEKSRHPILVFYLLSIVISSAVKLKDAINFLDIAFGLMAIPTIISATILAPKVMRMADSYFAKLRK